MILHALLIDASPASRHRLRALLAEAAPAVQVVGETATAGDAASFLRGRAPDLALLRVGPRAGSAWTEELRAAGLPPTIVVATSGEHAVRAFELDAVDYLVDPLTARRLQVAVERAFARIAARAVLGRVSDSPSQRAGVGAERSGRPPLEHLQVDARDRALVVRTASIDWIAAEGSYVRLHVGGTGHLHRTTLRRLEQVLDPARFVRIHRSTIVNIDRVREISPWSSGDAVLRLNDDTSLRLSRTYRRRFDELTGRLRDGAP